MKRSLFYLFLILCIGCHHDNSPAPNNLIGTWKMTSYAGIVTATYTAFPCLEDNILTINANGTATQKYTGSAPCALSGGLDKIGVTVGSPGKPQAKITWIQSGGTTNFTQVSPAVDNPNFTGVISYMDNKTTLITTYTEHVLSSTITSTATWVKQ
ncbi:MAG: lipocalin family protein [Mucilaginibacter sp.]